MWTQETQDISRKHFEEMSFVCRDKKVWCKHYSRRFAYMHDHDVIAGEYQLYTPDGELMDRFESIDAWLAAGWVLD